LWHQVNLSSIKDELFENSECFIRLGKRVGKFIQELSLFKCPLTDALLSRFIEFVPNLRQLDISNTTVSSTAISKVLDACPKLTEIDASGTILELPQWIKFKKKLQETNRNVDIHAGHVLYELSARKRHDFLTNLTPLDPKREGILKEWLTEKSLLWCLKNCQSSTIWMDQVIECFENSSVDWGNVEFKFVDKHLTQFHIVRALKKAGFNRWKEADPQRLNSFIRRNSFREVPPILSEWASTEFKNWSAVWEFDSLFIERFLSHSWGFEDLQVLGNTKMHEFCRDKINLEKLVTDGNLMAVHNLGLMGFETSQEISGVVFENLLTCRNSEMIQALSKFLSNLPEIPLHLVEEITLEGDLKVMDALDACRFDWDQIPPQLLLTIAKMDRIEPISKLKELGYSRWSELEIPIWVDRGARGLLHDFILKERNLLINEISEAEIQENYRNFRRPSETIDVDELLSNDWDASDDYVSSSEEEDYHLCSSYECEDMMI